ncbi:MAG: hypothetical protein R2834_22475 [Rhodothermales bacterium]
MTEHILVKQHDVAQLVGLAADGLRSMYDERKSAFCKRVSPSSQGLRRVGTSYAGSLVATMGLNEIARRGYWTAFATQSLAAELVERSASVKSTAELGLLVWMTARVAPQLLDRVFDAFDLRLALDAYPDGRAAETGALAWLLTGLSEARLAVGPDAEALEDVTHLTRQLLFVNYGGQGVFARQGKGMLGRRRGIFPDQAFSAYAFSRYARAFGDEASLHVARQVADRLVMNQGPIGQWWWRYDTTDGRVVDQYPVLSVHQYAIAPMALVEVSLLTGEDYADALIASLAWVRFGNERKVDLVDTKRKVVWDGLQRTRYTSYVRQLAPGRLFSRGGAAAARAAVIEECRPEHLGWLLYALSGGIQPDRGVTATFG